MSGNPGEGGAYWLADGQEPRVPALLPRGAVEPVAKRPGEESYTHTEDLQRIHC